jgi:hypothetical protein
MNIRAIAVALLLSSGSAVYAQSARIDHTPLPCLRGGRVYALAASTPAAGELRLFYRKSNTTWCSVVGTNRRDTSFVPLPKLADGDELEYFFVLVEKNRVIARSPEIYHVRVSDRCDSLPLRNMETPPSECTEQTNMIGAANAAAYALPVTGEPQPGSPDQPQ